MKTSEILERYAKYGPFRVSERFIISKIGSCWYYGDNENPILELPWAIALMAIESITMKEMRKRCLIETRDGPLDGMFQIVVQDKTRGPSYVRTCEEHQNRLELWEWFKGLEGK